MLNNPIKLVDPTGHKCVGEKEECKNENNRPMNGAYGRKYIRRNVQDMKRSDKLVDFLKYYEGNPGGGFPDQPYRDMGGTGTCTIGYGQVLPNGKDGCSGEVKKYYREHPLSLDDALGFLEGGITKAEALIKKTINVDLTQSQFDGLVSYIYNSGDQTNQPFITKGIPELINSGKLEEAAMAIESGPVTSNNQRSDRLVERRQAEADMFLFGIYIP